MRKIYYFVSISNRSVSLSSILCLFSYIFQMLFKLWRSYLRFICAFRSFFTNFFSYSFVSGFYYSSLCTHKRFETLRHQLFYYIVSFFLVFWRIIKLLDVVFFFFSLFYILLFLRLKRIHIRYSICIHFCSVYNAFGFYLLTNRIIIHHLRYSCSGFSLIVIVFLCKERSFPTRIVFLHPIQNRQRL